MAIVTVNGLPAIDGLRGNDQWAPEQRPTSYRESILYLYPNGTAPLTALLAAFGSESTDDPEFNWWTKSLPTQRGVITGVYTNTALTTAYTGGGGVGSTIYIKMSNNDISQFREGHQVLLRYSLDLTVDVNTKITSKVVASEGSSYLGARLLENDNNSATNSLAKANVALVIGNINPEGGDIPGSISYNPDKWYNYTQIFRTPLNLTRTAMQTKLRVRPDQWKEMHREALEQHSIEMEKAFFFGISTERTGTNGMPERTTLGIIPAIKGGYSGSGGPAGTVSNYATDAAYAGKTWLAGGEDWLNTNLANVFKYGSTEKVCYCGNSVLIAIQNLVRNSTRYNIQTGITSYGIKVTRWETVFGVVNFINHPLFSYEPTMANSAVIIEPKNIKQRHIQDTMLKKDDAWKKGSHTSRDAINEEYLTEIGLEYHHPIGWAYLNGWGEDNKVTKA